MVDHILRPNSLSKLIIQGNTEGKIRRERSRSEYMSQNIKGMGLKRYRELKELSIDKESVAINRSRVWKPKE